jgi:transposase
MRRKIKGWLDAALRAKVALEAFWNEATVAELSAKYQLHSNQIYAWKKQLLDGAAAVSSGGTTAKRASAFAARCATRLAPRIASVKLRGSRRSPGTRLLPMESGSPRHKSAQDSAASCRGVTTAAVGSAATGHSRSREKRCFRQARIHVGGSPKSDTFFPSAKDRER